MPASVVNVRELQAQLVPVEGAFRLGGTSA